ncbi:MAG: methyltransferase domain-containing protein [Deltaproteobacteria bacterium]|nr:methyltransferase domain-containing protein [Deltaproteobacteria bacterium]
MTNFSAIAPSYQKNSLVQASEGEMLLSLLRLAGDEDILDVGCGTGNLTAVLRAKTSGRVVGIDRAEGMLGQAQAFHGDQGIEFLSADSENLPFAGEFDCIFCNSVFQWFPRPAVNLAGFYRALRPDGRVGVQTPATSSYCPNFLQAIEHCRRSPELDSLFAWFRSPWFFLDTDEAYRALFTKAGFRVATCRIDTVNRGYTVPQAMDIFNSGAAAGYLNQSYFSVPLPSDFAKRVRAEVREAFAEQADANGRIDLVFKRLFVLAGK